jgi:hypothetical protein
MEKQSNETLPQPYEEYKKVLDMKIGEGTSVIHSQIPRQNMFVTLQGLKHSSSRRNISLFSILSYSLNCLAGFAQNHKLQTEKGQKQNKNIEHLLGKGGHGSVFSGTFGKSKVAVKRVLVIDATNENEGKVMQQLNQHRQTVSLL